MVKWSVFSIFTRRRPDGSLVEFPEALDSWIEEIILADRLGFDTYWMAEHHFHEEGFESITNPSLLMAAVAERAPNIRLGTAAYVLPWHQPIRLAEDIAFLDHLTRGRIEVGIARGYSPVEAAGMGAPLDEEQNRQSFEEAIDLIYEAWSDNRIAYSPNRQVHRYPSSPDGPAIGVVPKPVQKPNPPVWIAGYSPRTLQMAAERGMGIMVHNLSNAMLEQVLTNYQNVASETLSRQLRKGENVALFRDVYVAPTDAEARQDIEDYVLEYVRFFGNFGFFQALVRPGEDVPSLEQVTWEMLQDQLTVHGSPEYCTQRLAATLEQFPVDVLALHIQSPDHEKRLRSLELFAKEVRPALEAMQSV